MLRMAPRKVRNTSSVYTVRRSFVHCDNNPVLVNAGLKAVELRLERERKTLEAVHAMPPVPPTADEAA